MSINKAGLRLKRDVKQTGGEYNTVTVEAARTGWVVKENGRLTEVFVRWEALTRYLESRLATRFVVNSN